MWHGHQTYTHAARRPRKKKKATKLLLKTCVMRPFLFAYRSIHFRCRWMQNDPDWMAGGEKVLAQSDIYWFPILPQVTDTYHVPHQSYTLSSLAFNGQALHSFRSPLQWQSQRRRRRRRKNWLTLNERCTQNGKRHQITDAAMRKSGGAESIQQPRCEKQSATTDVLNLTYMVHKQTDFIDFVILNEEKKYFREISFFVFSFDRKRRAKKPFASEMLKMYRISKSKHHKLAITNGLLNQNWINWTEKTKHQTFHDDRKTLQFPREFWRRARSQVGMAVIQYFRRNICVHHWYSSTSLTAMLCCMTSDGMDVHIRFILNSSKMRMVCPDGLFLLYTSWFFLMLPSVRQTVLVSFYLHDIAIWVIFMATDGSRRTYTNTHATWMSLWNRFLFFSFRAIPLNLNATMC